MINLYVLRNAKSFDFKADPSRPDSFENNWKNNSLDRLCIRDDNKAIACYPCQTVANYCFGAQKTASTVPWGDTIAPGGFTVRAFAPPRNFHGEVHAVTRTRDIDGEWIDREAMQTTAGGFQNGRWLIHDRFSFKTMADTASAWSAGCVILSSRDLQNFNDELHRLGVKPGDLIPGLLVQE